MKYLNEDTGERWVMIARIANLTIDAQVKAVGRELLQAFGGYTAQPFTGGWRDACGNAMVEHGTQYEVAIDAGDGNALSQFRAIVARAGQAIGEQWVHIERRDCHAFHVQVNSAPAPWPRDPNSRGASRNVRLDPHGPR